MFIKKEAEHALSRLGDRCINFSYISRFFFFQLFVDYSIIFYAFIF